jgi:predicted RNase H-like nuclease (RuvC/YqgF family)
MAASKKPLATTGFVDKIVAVIKGADAQQIGEKIQKQMNNGLTSQIGLKEAATFDYEEAVEKAQEEVTKSLMNYGREVENRENSVQNYLTAQANLKKKEKELEQHLQTIEWLKEGVTIVSQ